MFSELKLFPNLDIIEWYKYSIDNSRYSDRGWRGAEWDFQTTRAAEGERNKLEKHS